MSKSNKIAYLSLIASLILMFGCQANLSSVVRQNSPDIISAASARPKIAEIQSGEIRNLLESAIEQTNLTKEYDPEYVVLTYPNGDVPIKTGVCSDVVIRAFRKAGVDLQKELHEDMTANFSAYPKKWNLKSPDSNIDHRRVPNLQTFFMRRGKSLPMTQNPIDYKPGDVVAWDLDGKGMTHIGLVSNLYNETTKRYLIVHNIGAGAQTDDKIFDWKIIGHYRYF